MRPEYTLMPHPRRTTNGEVFLTAQSPTHIAASGSTSCRSISLVTLPHIQAGLTCITARCLISSSYSALYMIPSCSGSCAWGWCLAAAADTPTRQRVKIQSIAASDLRQGFVELWGESEVSDDEALRDREGRGPTSMHLTLRTSVASVWSAGEPMFVHRLIVDVWLFLGFTKVLGRSVVAKFDDS